MQNSYDEFKEEVIEYNRTIINLCKKNEEINSLYEGYKILYSPLIKEPQFMLIGINPGCGHKKKSSNEFVEVSAPLPEMEYFKYSYSLAKETRNTFHKAGLLDVLESNTVKSNFYYFSTCKANNLWNLSSIILKSDNMDLWEKSAEWTKKLISIVSPKTIVCEGKSAFDNVYFCLFNENVDWSGEATIEVEKNGFHLIGYKRRFSNIEDKDSLSALLKKAR